MQGHDCVVLYNTASMSESSSSRESLYPSTLIREDVGAVEQSLREGGFNPCVISVDYFSDNLVSELSRIAPKFIFNLCEEINRNSQLEMCVAALLEAMSIPYTGSGPLALGLALDKFRMKELLRGAGISTARGYLCSPGHRPSLQTLGFPVIVKPVHEDASLGINSNSVCHGPEALEKQVTYIHEAYRQDALVEEFIEGREFNISLIGNEDIRVLPLSEIDFSGLPQDEPRIVSYRAKWDEESLMYQGTVPVCPARVAKRTAGRLVRAALRSFQCVGCRDYARIDMRTDACGNIYVLEVNPNPDISPEAGFARAARAAGLSYPELVLNISKLAMERAAKVPSMAYAFP